MTAPAVAQAIEDLYTSLHNDNVEIDARIAKLRQALQAEGQKEAVFAPSRLAQNNRQGRKMMQTYFRKRGVTVVFKEAETAAPGE
jgi:hypothetical protein